ncbi:uncharacterized protein METZ01_LOCUS268968 [marine metagenome]|uniref:NADP-dependent oxidoreductase domain-containing protein n=1 Tax=marine metagenome TaxID=408172 RepID=A0A382JUE6_9ZZZZ
MEKRKLGKTEQFLSVIGFGAIIFVKENRKFAEDSVARAIDSGINYFDMGPGYGNGQAEELGGPAISPFRDKIFLAEKTGKRTKNEALTELKQSLVKMNTDYFDLYQFHAVKTLEEVKILTGPNGALEGFLEARKQGLIRYLGFSAHSEEAALALLKQFDFDSILYPLNFVSWYQGHFGQSVINAAKEKEMGILALKTLAKTSRETRHEGNWQKAWYNPVETYAEAKAALQWTLSLPVTSCVSPSHAELLWWMVDAEKEIEPLSKDDGVKIADTTKGVKPIFSNR